MQKVLMKKAVEAKVCIQFEERLKSGVSRTTYVELRTGILTQKYAENEAYNGWPKFWAQIISNPFWFFPYESPKPTSVKLLLRILAR